MLNNLLRLQFERINEIQGLESKPYIVTKAMDATMVTPMSRKSRSYSNSHKNISQELGFTMAYISYEFEKSFLKEMELKIEELVFRKVSLNDCESKYKYN